VRNRWILVAAAAGAVVLAGGLIAASQLSGEGSDEPEPVAAPPPAATEAAPPPAATGGEPPAATGDEPAGPRGLLDGIPQEGLVLGDPSAPVTIVEFADLQCPFCAEWSNEVFPGVVERYVRPGHARIVFQGLAFIGDDSEKALRAVLAAGLQNRLWEMVELLYVFQGEENSGWVTDDLLREVAARIPGLDADRMFADMPSDTVTDGIEASRAEAAEAGVQGTPTLFYGTATQLQLLGAGVVPIDAVAEAIDPLIGQ
jgi:protein-disulfide isomerase